MQLSSEQIEAIEQLYREQYEQMSYYAYQMFGRRDLAEEAVQDTFRIACAKADDLLASENPPGWLMNTLKNVIRSRKKAFARFAKIFTAQPLDPGIVQTEETAQELRLMIQEALNVEEYLLFRIVIAEEKPLLVAAKQLGISLPACKKRMQRLREKLRRILAE